MTGPVAPDRVGSERQPDGSAIVVEHLMKRFRLRSGSQEVLAVNDVSFDVPAGSTLGIVGESGSGKSTLARCMLGLLPFDQGRVEVLGASISGAGDAALRALRARAQIVFQEPLESLDPRLRVGEAIAEPLKIRDRSRRGANRDRVAELLGMVALAPELADRFPHQLSGGQQQRVNIARALATEPAVVVLDEPTSSLDVSVRSEVLKLLASLQDKLHLTYVLISHDLATIRAMSTDIAVMYLGSIVEHGPAGQVLERADHPYTRFLLGSELSLDPHDRSARSTREAAPPNPGSASPVGNGCAFAARCPDRIEICGQQQPVLFRTDAATRVACHLVDGSPGSVGGDVEAKRVLV